MSGQATPSSAETELTRLPHPHPPTLYIGGEIYRHSSFGRSHPLSIPRVSVATDLCRAMGWLDDAAYREAPIAAASDVWRFHDPDYIAALYRAEQEQQVSEQVRARYHLGTGDNPVYPEMARRPMTGAGGLMLAARLTAPKGGTGAGEATIVYCPGGGTHHGRPDRASGFCYLNDVVLALMVWREHGLRRIAYVDIDAHHGDGVQDAFGSDPLVFTFSIHEEKRWPMRQREGGADPHGNKLGGSGLAEDRAGGAARNFPVPAGLNDSEMRVLMTEAVLPLLRAHQPQAIFLQCGADALEEDPLSRLSLSNNAHIEIAAQLRDIATARRIPLIVSGGGGYNPFSVGRCWASVWATLNRIPIPDRVTPEAERVLRALHYPRAAGRNPPIHWFTTLRDAKREGPVRSTVRDLAALACKEVV